MRSRPWRRSLRRRSPPPDVTIVGEQPLATLAIYRQAVLLARRNGITWTQYPVRAEDIARVLGNIPHTSGLLPPNTLAAGQLNGERFLVLYVPPQHAALALESEVFDIPLPPLIWASCGANHRIWALNTLEYPEVHSPLCMAPFPNVYPDAQICWGTVEKTRPSLELFLQSGFNLHLAGERSRRFGVSVVAQWRHLVETQATKYPLDDLIETGHTVGWLVEGGPWK